MHITDPFGYILIVGCVPNFSTVTSFCFVVGLILILYVLFFNSFLFCREELSIAYYCHIPLHRIILHLYFAFVPFMVNVTSHTALHRTTINIEEFKASPGTR